jgi:hypothetical protein
MKPTKKQLREIEEIEKKVANVCDSNDGVVDEITGITYPKKTIEVTLNENGVIVNRETGKPHFGAIDIDEMKKMVEEKKSKEIVISLSFGTNCPSLKKQIKKQGFEISNDYIERAEAIRYDLNSLNTVGIIKDKELFKCFKRLNKKICKKMLEPLLKDGEKAVLTKEKFTK